MKKNVDKIQTDIVDGHKKEKDRNQESRLAYTKSS